MKVPHVKIFLVFYIVIFQPTSIHTFKHDW